VFFDRRIRALLIIGGVFSVGVAVNAFFFPRYAAPVTGILYVLLIQCMRHLRSNPAGRLLVRSIPLVCLLSAGLLVVAQPLHIHSERFPTLWYGPGPVGTSRARVESDMESRPGKHLLIVRYAPDHDCLDDWVYNRADIDGSKTVWAREMSSEQNERLIAYFKGRDAWLVEPDKNPPAISPYPEARPEVRPE
jgi:hypothetical protein